MLRRRLILPALVRGPLRLRTDAEPRVARAKRTASPRILLVLVWLVLCAGLYLIGNWPRGSAPPPITATAPTPAVRRSIPPPTASPSPPPASDLAPKAPPGALKPLRDNSNLAVFGTGLERAADLSGPYPGGPDPNWPPDEPGSAADPGATGDPNTGDQN